MNVALIGLGSVGKGVAGILAKKDFDIKLLVLDYMQIMSTF